MDLLNELCIDMSESGIDSKDFGSLDPNEVKHLSKIFIRAKSHQFDKMTSLKVLELKS